jgi:hypothetical protein
MLQFLLPAMGLAGSMIGGAASLAGGAMSLGGGLLHAGSTAVGLGAKGIGAIGKAAGGLLPGGGTDREIQGAQQQGQPDINGKYFNEKTNRWHDRSNNNRFTSAPAQFGAQGMAGGQGIAGGVGGGEQGELFSAEETHSEKPQDEVGAFGMLIGLLGGMANDIAIIKELTSGILNSMIGEAQKDAQMELQEFAERQEAQRGQDEFKDDIQRDTSLADTGEGGKGGKKTPGVLSKLFGAGKTGMSKLLNQPNWIKAIGLGGLLWWLSKNKEGFIKGLTVVLEWVHDLTKKFSNIDFEDFTIKGFAANLAEGIGTLFDKIKESELFKTLWPPMRDLIHDFAAAVFKMGKEILDEFLPWKQSFGKSNRAIAGRTGEAQGFKSTLGGLQESMGADLTEESFEGLAKDDPRKERIEVAKEALYKEMQMISRESKRRVQWKGITGTHGLLGRDDLSGLPLKTPPLEALLRTVPIIDGDEATWGQLADIDLSVGIPADATKGQIRDIEKLYEKKSELQGNVFATQAIKVKGEEGGYTVDMPGRLDTVDERAARVAKLQAEKAAIDEELPVLNVSYGKAEVKTDGTTPALLRPTPGSAAALQSEVKAIPKIVTKGADTSGSTLTMKKELTKAMDMTGVETVDYLDGEYGELGQTGQFRNGILIDTKGKESVFNEETANIIAGEFNDASNGEGSPDSYGVGSANGKWYVVRNPDNLTNIPKNIGGKNGFGTFAQSGDQIPIAQMDASVKSYLNQEYTKDEWEEFSPSKRSTEKKKAQMKIRAGEVLLVPNTSTSQLVAANATSKEMTQGDGKGLSVNTFTTEGSKSVINQNTVMQAKIAAENTEWTQKLLFAGKLSGGL